MEGGIKTFLRGVVTGAGIMLALVLVIAGLWFFHNRDKEIYEYMERKMRYRNCGRMGSYGTFAIVILMSFLTTFPAHGEPPTAALNEYTGSGTKLYSDNEVQGMIDELTEAAEEAIETAAAEAAKAAVIREAQQWRGEYTALKSKSVKTAILTGVICFLSGFAIGAGSVLIIQGGR